MQAAQPQEAPKVIFKAKEEKVEWVPLQKKQVTVTDERVGKIISSFVQNMTSLGLGLIVAHEAVSIFIAGTGTHTDMFYSMLRDAFKTLFSLGDSILRHFI